MISVPQRLATIILTTICVACVRTRVELPVPAIVTGAHAPLFSPDTVRYREQPRTVTIRINEAAGLPKSDALVIIDGRVIGRYSDGGEGVLRAIPPTEVASIEIITPSDAVQRFGLAAAGGAMLIRTK
jgi:hypothetical protein